MGGWRNGRRHRLKICCPVRDVRVQVPPRPFCLYRAISSVGGALPRHGRGHRFKPCIAHISEYKMNEDVLTYLYIDKKMSMMDIACKLKVTHAKVNYWLEKFNVARRGQRESSYAKHNPQGDPFKIKEKLTFKERQLLLLGLMLYWAEGNKKNQSTVALGNLDGRMIKLFLKFLRDICQIEEKRIRLYVRIYKNFSKEKARLYWKNLLSLPEKQVLMYTHNDLRSNPNKQWSKNGIATLQMSNVKLKQWLDQSIEECLHQFVA